MGEGDMVRWAISFCFVSILLAEPLARAEESAQPLLTPVEAVTVALKRIEALRLEGNFPTNEPLADFLQQVEFLIRQENPLRLI